MNTAIVPQIGLPTLTHTSDAAQVISMIERVVKDPSIDLARLEKLMEMRERMITRSAEVAFNDAMMRAQSEMEPIAKDCNNPQTRSRYASYAAMDMALRPIYTKNGFALSFNTTEGAPDNCIRIVCDVSCGGHSRRYHIDMPADGKGAKGGDVMTRTHATGSAVSYARRYLLGMIFNAAVGDVVDDDGNAAGQRMSARARNEIIKDDPEACQRVADEYGEREGARMINAMRPDDIVIWNETEVTSKAQFLITTREHIRIATDGQALADWWNSPQEKENRKDFELTRNEFASLRDFLTARLAHLKQKMTGGRDA